MRIRFLKCLLSGVLILLAGFEMNAETASQIMSKAAAAINASKGISANFTLTGGGQNISGAIAMQGNKFKYSTQGFSIWYNGKYMWTYNASSGETTLVTPSREELVETNPLEYIKTYSANYTASFSSKNRNSQYVVNLSPKSKRNQIKNIEITIQPKTYRPLEFTVTPKSGAAVKIKITKSDYKASFKSSDFEYPKAKYPKAQIIDLR